MCAVIPSSRHLLSPEYQRRLSRSGVALILPDLKDWQSWTKLLAALGTIVAIAVAAPKAEPFFYTSSQYVRDALSPLLAVSYENKIEIIEGRQAIYRMSIDNATARLRTAPDDPVIADALRTAQKLYNDAQYQKDEAYCRLREARGLSCGGG